MARWNILNASLWFIVYEFYRNEKERSKYTINIKFTTTINLNASFVRILKSNVMCISILIECAGNEKVKSIVYKMKIL